MAAPSFVGTNYAGGLASPGSSVVVTLPGAHLTTSLAVLLLTCFSTTNPNTLTPTDNLTPDLTWTLRAGNSSGTIGAAIWTAPITTAGTLAATVAGFGAGDFLRAFLYEIKDWDPSVVDGTGTTATGNSNAPSVDLPATSFADDLQMGCSTCDDSPRTYSAGTNYTLGPVSDNSDNVTNQICSIIYRTLSATGNFDPLWSVSSSGTWIAAALTIKGFVAGQALPLMGRRLWVNP
jgi:hypothetical protein